MTRYLLDTGPLSALLLGRLGAVTLLAPWVSRGEATTSLIVYGEVHEYIRGSNNYAAHHSGLLKLLTSVHPYVITKPIMQRYSAIRMQLRPQNALIGDIDTLIAATAMERNATLVTIDTDFLRVPGLSVLPLTRGQLR